MKADSQKFFLNIRCDLLICLFLVIATLAVYQQVRHYDFVGYDDDDYVFENPHIRAGLTLNSIKWAFTAVHADNWHPVTWLSHILDIELYGLNPGQHHLTNLIFHIVNSLLLFLIFRRMTGDLWQSGFVAALFALHPLHVESVAWISERKDVLSTFFLLLTIQSYVRYVEKPTPRRYLLSLFFFIPGLMSKAMLVTLPLVLLLLDYWPLKRLKPEKKIYSILLEKIPFFIFSAGSAIVTIFAQNSGGAIKTLKAYPFDVRIANAFVSYIAYIGKMICPFDLAFFYPHPGTVMLWQTAGSCAALIVISLLIVRKAKSSPYLIVGWLWYLITLIPVIGLVQIGLQSMADRYSYIPLIGLFIMSAWGIADIPLHRKTGFAVTAAAFFSIYMTASWMQTGYWSSSTALFEHALDVTSKNHVAHFGLGNVLLAKGEIDKAVGHYSEALKLFPASDIHNNMGVALARKGMTDEAVAHYREALRMDPYHRTTYNNLGVLLLSRGDNDKAVECYRIALKLFPDYAQAHNNLGLALARKGKNDEAIAHFRTALQIKPDFPTAYDNLKAVMGKQKKTTGTEKIGIEEPDSISDRY